MQMLARQRGFSLIEVAVTVAIIAIAAGIMLPAMANIGRADLAKTARMLSTLIRQTYSEAALTGQTQRLVFEFGSPKVKIQSSAAVLMFDPDSNKLVESAKANQELQDQIGSALLEAQGQIDAEKSEQEAPAFNPLSALMGMNQLARRASEDGEGGFTGSKTFEFEDGVKIMDFWTEGMSSPESEGVHYLIFFAHGSTQQAVINLTNEDGHVYAVVVSPLTGQTEIFDSYTEPPK